MREKYIGLVILNFMGSKSFDAILGQGWHHQDSYNGLADKVIENAFASYPVDYDIGECRAVFDGVFQDLIVSNVIVRDGDKYSENWFKLVSDRKANVINSLLSKNAAYQRIASLGLPALERAISNIFPGSSEESEAFGDIGKELEVVPASDRIVRLDHNQIIESDESVTKLIDTLEADNGSPENPGLRERLLGQIRAARELIRVGEYRAYLMYELLIRSLNEIVAKYGNPTIKSLAEALLAALAAKLIEV